MRTQKRDKHILIRVSMAERESLRKAAVLADVPAAQLVRRAIKHIVSQMEQRPA